MNRQLAGRIFAGTLLLVALGSLALPAAAAPAAGTPVAPPAATLAGPLFAPALAPPAQVTEAFLRVWSRADWPVALKLATRSWTWGPRPLDMRNEPFAQAPGGQRTVQYFDKARMEVTNPGGDPNNPWYVTNGRMTSPTLYENEWYAFTGGQAMGQPWRAAVITTPSAGTIRLQFSDATHATLTLPDGRQVALIRFEF